MDLCMLTLDGARTAEIALEETLLVTEGRFHWLYDVAIVRRSALGRLTILGSPGKNAVTRFVYEEGELAARAAEPHRRAASLGSPALHSGDVAPDCPWAAAMLADEVERQFFHTPVLRGLLRRDSSALLLVAEAQTCLVMIHLFERYAPAVRSRHWHGKIRTDLESSDAPDELVDRATRTSTLH